MGAPTVPSDLAPAPPFCPHYGICGSCQLQHVSDAAASQWKTRRLADALARRGMPVVGYMEARSAAIAPIEACPVAVPALRQAPAMVAALAVAAGRFKTLD